MGAKAPLSTRSDGLAAAMLSGDALLSAQWRAALVDEAAAITAFAAQADDAITRAVHMIHASSGPLIVAGMGKSGHIASKIASTFRSIGKPSVFLHPSEASHGDLGLIAADSVVLILSNSGETTELSDLIQFCRSHEIAMIALTARASSTLAKAARIAIAYGTVKEVCPNGLAPTTSTTLSLAIGDALAVGLTHLTGAAAEDFRRYHPGGALGARVLTVAELMHVGDALPLVAPDAAMSDVVVAITEKSFGVAILWEDGRVAGVVTDGDMRRNAADLWSKRAGDIATRNPRYIRADLLASEAVAYMTRARITACLVEDAEGRFAGLLHMHDCLRAGVTA